MTPDEELLEAVAEVEALQELAKTTEDMLAKSKATLIDIMANREESTAVVEDGDQAIKVTIVAAERVSVDSDGLREAVGKRVYNSLRPDKADPKKVEAAVAAGELELAAVAPFITIKKSAAYPRIARTALEGD